MSLMSCHLASCQLTAQCMHKPHACRPMLQSSFLRVPLYSWPSGMGGRSQGAWSACCGQSFLCALHCMDLVSKHWQSALYLFLYLFFFFFFFFNCFAWSLSWALSFVCCVQNLATHCQQSVRLVSAAVQWVLLLTAKWAVSCSVKRSDVYIMTACLVPR